MYQKGYQYVVANYDSPLTEEQIRAHCPAVFAVAPHSSRSQRFTHIGTFDIFQLLQQSGYGVALAMQSKSRDETKIGFTKHLLRVRRVEDFGRSDDVVEGVIVNADDGSAAYHIYTGIFRHICSNGGIAIGTDTGSYKVRHQGNIVEQVVESTVRIVEESGDVLDTLDAMKGVQLTSDERLRLAQFAVAARFDLPDTKPETLALVPYSPMQFLVPRRREDRGQTDLYHTYQTLQENAIKGNISTDDAKGRRHTTRQINNIPQNLKVNTLLWQFSQALLQSK